MTPLGKFTLRLAVYGTVIAWLAGDLFLFHGPLRRRMDRADPRNPESVSLVKSRGVVARVFNHQITRDQLERAVHERLWLEGKTSDGLPKEQLKLVRYAALDDLINHELLRVKAKVNAPQLKVEEEEVDERLRRLLGRFESKGAMEAAMKAQGIPNERELRDRLSARIQQEKYVEQKIGPLTGVTTEEARDWFENNRDKLALPERVRVRHVFIATLDRPADEAKNILQAALADLEAGKSDFASLATTISEDPESKTRGGDLGWMSRSRLPADFSAPVFSLPLHRPELLQTHIGWHLVEVTARKAAEPREFAEAEAEVMAALKAVKRQKAVTEYSHALRRFEAEKIDVYHDVVSE